MSTYDYLAAFINGGLRSPIMTDVVVVDLNRGADGAITGFGQLSRVTTTATPGVGHYFPAFFPDGKVMYISNAVPQKSEAPKYSFTVVDPAAERRVTSVFATPAARENASALGQLWKDACAPDLPAFKPHEAAWYALGLSPAQCRSLVADRTSAQDPQRAGLLSACDAIAPGGR